MSIQINTWVGRVSAILQDFAQTHLGLQKTATPRQYLCSAVGTLALSVNMWQAAPNPPITISTAAVLEVQRLYNQEAEPSGPFQYTEEWKQMIRNAAPNWRFARALSHTTCLPTWAYDSTGKATAPAPLKYWPIPGQGGCTNNDAYTEMVTYADPRLCDMNTIRIGYWLYFKKDGFKSAGHGHDWEGVIVELKRLPIDGGTKWTRNQVIGSWHTTYIRSSWSDNQVQKTSDGMHPILFVGWAHHAMEWDKGGAADIATTWYNDLRNSFRQVDSWNNLVFIPLESLAARTTLASHDYGDANPPLTKSICTI